ncbi:COX15/CtaA family protein [Terricaulis silvestris]|uniref:Heme A synthase n=1 Tax=Terricaulis silvestris TaxID=2686094 RepID=A0A6I6MMK6_9CAUL|nr:COX15/CtaA family protein [Terricaulis silvestris]QGZ95271.1 Heme A synthase [Terricaulis silvestris]
MASDDIWPPRDKWVGIWLLVICALVTCMILVGGATRLTDSGLSITEWNVMKHFVPPMNETAWAQEFALYQRTLEYQNQNYGMSLTQFRQIYLWEWGHRFLGQLIGMAFALPALFFLFTGRLRGRFRVTGLLFVLGGLQGAIGWWMVTSGLFDRLDVSPVRLAIHLGMALFILALAFSVALGAFGWPRTPTQLGAPRWAPSLLLVLVFVQAMLGALLAGSDGGRAYADWPTIGGEWIPSSAFGLESFWANFTEDHATQHLLHRTSGYVVALAAVSVALASLLRGEGEGRAAGLAIGALALLQVMLGVLTVLAAAPLSLSLLHQFGAVALWIATVGTIRLVRR